MFNDTDLLSLNYSDLINLGKVEDDLKDVSSKFNEDSTNEDNIVVVVKDPIVSDEDARLPYVTKNQTIYAHALVHAWWNNPEKTKWTKLQVSREHTRIVAKLVSNSWGHMVKDTLDETLPESLRKDFLPSQGDSTLKPTKILIVTNAQHTQALKHREDTFLFKAQAPIFDSSDNAALTEQIGAMRVILNQESFDPSVSIEEISKNKEDIEYKKLLNDDLSGYLEENETAIFLRINAMHEGIWNFTEISKDELIKSANTYVGRLVIEGHNWDDPSKSLGEVLKASVKFDTVQQKYYLEVIAKINKEAAIKEIRAGRYKFVSIGATMKARCNICGLTVNEGCEHIRGIEYDTVEHGRIICIKTASEIIFEELSFINVPAARWARVLEEIDPTQVRELLAASKSGHTVGIEIESNDTRILPTLDELLSFQEQGIRKFYNKNQEERMANKEKKGTIAEKILLQQGNISDVAVPTANPVVAATVDTGARDASAQDIPALATSNSEGNTSSVEAPANPVDAGTVNTGDNSTATIDAPALAASDSEGNISTVEAPANNPVDAGVVDSSVNSETVIDDISLLNDKLDDMDVSSIYAYAKENGMTGIIEIMVASNLEAEKKKEGKESGGCKSALFTISSVYEAILVHGLLHIWNEDLSLTNWTEEQISAEHDRIVAVLKEYDVGHEEEAETSLESVAVNSDTVVDTVPAINTVIDPVADATVIEVGNSTIEVPVIVDAPAINPDLELLNLQLEKANSEIASLQEKYDVIVKQSSEAKESLSKEVLDIKLYLVKALNDNKQLSTDLEAVNTVLSSKDKELELLKSEVSGYVQKAVEEVVDQIICIKKDLNKYNDEQAVEQDKAKFSAMSLEVLKTLVVELNEIKVNSIKNKVSMEHGIGEVVTQSAAGVTANDEIINTQPVAQPVAAENVEKVVLGKAGKKSLFSLISESLGR